MTTETSTPEPARDGGGAVGMVYVPGRIHAAAITETEVVLLGQPPESEDEETGHNCDAMGCGQDHVLWRGARLRATPPAAVGDDERVVRHPNGHLMIERAPRYVPSDVEIAKAFASLSKAWPYLADHAPHIDGEFDNALTNLRRMVDALRTQPTPTPAGGDVAAAVPFSMLVDELHGFADARMIVPDEDPAHVLETAESEALRRLAGNLLAAHEAAVRAVEGELLKANEAREAEADDRARAMALLYETERRLDDEAREHRTVRESLATERARAEALGAAALAYYRASSAWFNSTLGAAGGPPIEFNEVLDTGAALIPHLAGARAAETAGAPDA